MNVSGKQRVMRSRLGVFSMKHTVGSMMKGKSEILKDEELMKQLTESEKDIREGRVYSLEDAKKELVL